MADGVIIRPDDVSDAVAIARVHVDSWRTTYAGIVPDDYLDASPTDQEEN